jgi:hypothetical protein
MLEARMADLPHFPVEGGCICDAVRYRVKAPPLGVYRCHCKDCQRQSGAAYSISMIVRKADFELLAGAPLAFDKPADSGRVVRQYTCPICHTRIFNAPLSSPGLVVVKAGTLDDAGWAVPIGNIWTQSKVPWVTIDPTQPNFPGQADPREPLFAAWRAHFGLED